MNFYEIKSRAVGYTKYPWVASWGPLEDMPFFETLAPATQKVKMQSWEINCDPPGLSIDPGGNEWADVLGCGGGPPSYFVSERIVNELQQMGVPFLRATEIPIAKNLSKALKDVPAPKYFILEAEPGINYAYDLMGLAVNHSGKPVIDRSKKFPDSIYRLSSWNGADLFGKRGFYDSTINLLCTDIVKNLAERNKWTNIEFTPVKAA